MANLSVIIVTKNEAHNIRDCLESVRFANEIIVFDSGSNDGTPEICLEYTPHVIRTPDWPGDGPQKNRALKKVTQDWVLCLDADERVTPELAKEIINTINHTDKVAFSIPYRSTFCGKPIRFGDWSNEQHLRLFKYGQAQFTEDIVHCHLEVNGLSGTLKHLIIHHPFHHLDAMLNKLNVYSSQSALAKFHHGKKATLTTALTHSLWSFFRGYFLKLGFLDGKEGFLLAVGNAQGTYYRYVKLMYLCKQRASHG